MSNIVTDKDINNWRLHFSAIPYEQQTGGDIFIQNCLDTIESLRAELGMAKARITELADAYREEVRQFNAGHDAFFAGEPCDAAPNLEEDYDVWTCGWAWGKFVKDEAYNRQDEP